MPLPKNIERQHILLAIAELEKLRWDIVYNSVIYDLDYNGNRYPPKHVVRLANAFANGKKFDPLIFYPNEANHLLQRRGFIICKKVNKSYLVGVKPSPQPESVLELFANLEEILCSIEPKGFSRDVASWITDLEHNGKIPKHITMRMHTMRITRNKVAHEKKYSLSPAQTAAFRADWEAIQEWWSENSNV